MQSALETFIHILYQIPTQIYSVRKREYTVQVVLRLDFTKKVSSRKVRDNQVYYFSMNLYTSIWCFFSLKCKRWMNWMKMDQCKMRDPIHAITLIKAMYQIWAIIIPYYLGSIADGADRRNLRKLHFFNQQQKQVKCN